mgnify:CR=1 FL=1
MKQIKRFSVLIMLFVATAGVIACEEEEPARVNSNNSDNCMAELENLSDILYNKSMTFNSNPTNSNCNAVRTAALNLINAAENCGYGDLYEGQTETWLSIDCTVFD